MKMEHRTLNIGLLFLLLVANVLHAGQTLPNTWEEGCYYGGKRYNDGDHIVLDGRKIFCGFMNGESYDTRTGSTYYSHYAWGAASNISSKKRSAIHFSGGCFYLGKLYSESSFIEVDGKEYSCVHYPYIPGMEEQPELGSVLSHNWRWMTYAIPKI